jgi:hypothetical protein
VNNARRQYVTGQLGQTRQVRVARHQGFICAGCGVVFPRGTTYVLNRRETGGREKINSDCWARGERAEA